MDVCLVDWRHATIHRHCGLRAGPRVGFLWTYTRGDHHDGSRLCTIYAIGLQRGGLQLGQLLSPLSQDCPRLRPHNFRICVRKSDCALPGVSSENTALLERLHGEGSKGGEDARV